MKILIFLFLTFSLTSLANDHDKAEKSFDNISGKGQVKRNIKEIFMRDYFNPFFEDLISNPHAISDSSLLQGLYGTIRESVGYLDSSKSREESEFLLSIYGDFVREICKVLEPNKGAFYIRLKDKYPEFDYSFEFSYYDSGSIGRDRIPYTCAELMENLERFDLFTKKISKRSYNLKLNFKFSEVRGYRYGQ